MGINANNSKNTTGSKIEILEAASYPGRLVSVIDLGLQAQKAYKGKDKEPAYKVLTTYELADEFVKDEDGEEDKTKPRWVSEQFVLYSLTAEKAKSTDRYLAVDPQGIYNGDWAKCLGAPVLITLVINESKGKQYNNIAGTSPMRAKDAARLPELVNEAVSFDLDAPDVEVFKKLPPWVQKIIQENLEYKGSKLALLLGGDYTPPSTKANEPTKTNDDPDDDVPF